MAHFDIHFLTLVLFFLLSYPNPSNYLVNYLIYTHTSIHTQIQTPPPCQHHCYNMPGRPRSDIAEHKDLIIELYNNKTPWPKIEQILLTEHGCQAKARTIMRRFKEWNVEFHRIATEKNDRLRAKIQEYWADRATRPKNDGELYQRLTADGFIVTPTAIPRLRREMSLFRRWDERLGRVRPDSELRRKRRKQKHSVFTAAQLAPHPDHRPGFHAQLVHSGYTPFGSPQEQSEDAHFEFEEPEQPQPPQLTQRPQKPEQPPQLPPEPVPPQPQRAPVSAYQAPPSAPNPRPALAADNVPRKRGRPRKHPLPAAPATPGKRAPRRVDQQPLTILYAKKNA